MSEPVSFAVSASYPLSRGLTRVTILSSFCFAAALMMQSPHQNIQHNVVQHNVVQHRPILPRLISEPAPVVPSAFDEESTMRPAQLLDRWDGMIAEASQRFHVPTAWIRAVMRQESGGRTMTGEGVPIVSRAGAIGLMQLMPATYGELATKHGLGDNPYEPRDNIFAGVAYLRWLHQKYGYPAMFAAYNAGPGRLENHLRGASLPAETRAYVGSIARTLRLQVGKLQVGKLQVGNLQIGKTGKDDLGEARASLVSMTQPDGTPVRIDPSRVTSIRAALPGEYDWTVKTVLILGRHKQLAIREDVQVAAAAIRAPDVTV